MTTMNQEEIICAICSNKSDHTGIRSTNAFGFPDLDTRPPEMQRSTIRYMIQRCPNCGYCAPNISKSDQGISEIVESRIYQDILCRKGMPELANSFLAGAYINIEKGNYASAAWDAIHAAWICDDARELSEAIVCRKKAVELIEMAEAYDQQVAGQPGASDAISIDLMRRAGMGYQALEFASKVKNKNLDSIIMQVIEFEEVLIKKGDMNAHRISEALGEA